ncbi:hypothetical protein cypCar_00027806, partial [Cyprinus carpio]
MSEKENYQGHKAGSDKEEEQKKKEQYRVQSKPNIQMCAVHFTEDEDCFLNQQPAMCLWHNGCFYKVGQFKLCKDILGLLTHNLGYQPQIRAALEQRDLEYWRDEKFSATLSEDRWVQHRIDPPKAKLTMDPKWTEFFPNENINLQCEIEGGSSGWTFQWMKDTWTSENNSVLAITLKHSDSGKYSCKGKLKNRQVTTQQSNAFQLNVKDITPRPTIKKHEWFELFYTEEKVQLDCNMPEVRWEYRWYKDTSSDHKNLITDSEFTIDAVSLTDAGNYHCKAKRGDFSVDSETLRVRVQECQEKAELIADRVSAVHEDGVIKDEDTPASEANGLTSFK